VYISHEYKGVFRLQLDNELPRQNQLPSSRKKENASLTKFNNTIYYAYKDGIFKLNNKTNYLKRTPF
jgi:hypothetical protein